MTVKIAQFYRGYIPLPGAISLQFLGVDILVRILDNTF